ncbi:hypothetical protein Taro_012750 [Colocasia esculenta]|uniref:BEACH domain-containing protein n=1 Tax=Colocasia esculenta TaxID=4460 RepID=A0A843UDR0_COLES|nr:hypothetical protein [Colocasia esculenta]
MAEEDVRPRHRGGAAGVPCKMTCFECLQRQIHSDFSADLLFRYGVSDSALPFGSAAVVEVNLNEGAEEPRSVGAAAQFLLVRLPNQDDVFFGSSYSLDNSKLDDLSGERRGSSVENDSNRSENSAGVSHEDNSDLATFNSGSKHPFDRPRAFMRHVYITKLITSLSPGCHIGIGSYTVIEDLVSKLLSGSTEDHVISSLHLFLEGKAPGPCAADFLNSIGLPSFMEKDVPYCMRHPNIAPIIGVLQTVGYTNLLQYKTPYTLENIFHYSPNTLKSDWQIRFLMYQILCALSYIHGLGSAHGNICPSSIMLTDGYWSWLSICDGRLGTLDLKEVSVPSTNGHCCMENCPCQNIYANLRLSASIDWASDFRRWWVGELSNYEYLLILNKIAGRRWGDHTFHTVMPWVIDFSVKPDENSDAGWRDLEKSKWRLAKGDEQLDFTYLTSEVPHHISDECLSELAVCSYKARRLPLSILRSAVRSVYEPNEYPSNMQRLYQWTPDECIPEFYSDPRIFSSLHAGMSDLSVPSWAKSAEEFISLHRAALESNHVSQQIHHWIDITFGYKLSGEASILAKNVMLPTSDPTMPKSMGRRQLFSRPHPMRQCCAPNSLHNPKEHWINYHMPRNRSNKNINSSGKLDITQSPEQDCILSETSYLQELEEAASFCEHARYLCPVYSFGENIRKEMVINEQTDEGSMTCTLKRADTENNLAVSSESSDVDLACLLESFEVDDNGSMGFQELLLWRWQSSASEILSEHIAGDIFSVGCILAELYLKSPLFDSVSLRAYLDDDVLPGLLQELPPHVRMLVESCILKDWRRRPSAKSLLESHYFPPTVRAVYHFVAPLQVLSKAAARFQYAAKLAREGALKVMGPFAAEMCAPYCLALITTPLSDNGTESALCLLKQYVKCLEFHAVKSLVFPTIQKILQGADCSHLKISLLQDSFVREVWKHLGKHVYLEKMHPLIISNMCNTTHKISASAASVLLIGSSEELGLPVTIHQTILPLMHYFGRGLSVDGIDALVRIGGLLGVTFVTRHLLPLLRTVVLSCIDASHGYKPEPLQSWNFLALIDCFATLDGLVKLLPQDVVLKEVVLVAFISFLCIADWHREIAPELCYMFLEKYHNWKVEFIGGTSRSDGVENANIQRAAFSSVSSLDYNPAKLLLNGVGWSIPQSQGIKGIKSSTYYKKLDNQRSMIIKDMVNSNHDTLDPWFWFPSAAASWDVTDIFGRVGGLKDELPWKIKATVLCSARAHPGSLQSLAVCHDECTVFTGGVGPGFRGIIQKWELPRMNCVSGYYGHDEVVNDICILSVSGKIASCDGTIHIWSSLTGKLISSFAESSSNFPSSSASKVNGDPAHMLTSNSSSGIYSNAFSGSMYTCMHHLDFADKIVAGMGNGSIRFIDVAQDRKLHLWKSDAVENSLSSLVSAICSCGSDKLQAEKAALSPHWLAAGLSSGHCRLLDARSGEIVALWRAHDGYITKLAAPEEHMLVSSSLDKTLRIWDLRRNLSSQSNIFTGHTDGISSFAIWGQDVISISRNKIGLSSLSRAAFDGAQQLHILPRTLYSADRGMRNLSVLSAISILPFSRLFIVGTEDGHLKVCC